MIAIRGKLRKLCADRRGATAIEYGLIVALIVVAMIGGLTLLGSSTSDMWLKVNNAMQTS